MPSAFIKISIQPFKIAAIFILFCYSLMSCESGHSVNNEGVKVDDLYFLLNRDAEISHWNLDSFHCKEPKDTLYQNLNFSFSGALAVLQNKFKEIDSTNANIHTRQYAKSLILADFVYAAFSFQFLGPKYGMAADSTFLNTRNNWSKYSLEKCYGLGNSNQFSVYCSERTTFFLRLIDSLEHIKGYAVTIPDGIHVFPVLVIGDSSYIVDPYDPFIMVDTASKRIGTYTALLREGPNGKWIPIRTKRMFGRTRQLIGRQFSSILEKFYNDHSCICCQLNKYIGDNKTGLLSKLRPCFEIPEEPLYETFKVIPNDINKYEFEMNGRVDGLLVSHEDIMRYYVGLKCK